MIGEMIGKIAANSNLFRGCCQIVSTWLQWVGCGWTMVVFMRDELTFCPVISSISFLAQRRWL